MPNGPHAENEAFVRASVARGDVADFRQRPGYNPDDKPALPAAFVRRLLLGLETDQRGEPLRSLLPGVRIYGARLVDGELDLADCAGAGGTGLPALALDECDLPQGMDVSASRLSRLSLQRSRFGQIWADGLRIDGDFDFREALPAPESVGGNGMGYISLRGARVGGDVIGVGARLVARGRPALNMQSAQVAGSVSLFETGQLRFDAEGVVNMHGARIGGNLTCDGARLTAEKSALWADGIQIGGGLRLCAGTAPFEANGSIRLHGARIGGNVDCAGAQLKATDGMAVMAEGIQVEGAVLFMSLPGVRFEAVGTLNLLGARIKGNISCDGAKISARGGEALVVEGAEIGGALLLRSDGEWPFEAEGRVFLLGARISGNLGCAGGRFLNPGKDALVANRAVVGGTILLCAHDAHLFECHGAAVFTGVRVGGDVNCHYAKFSNPGRTALSMLSAEIAGDIALIGTVSRGPDPLVWLESDGTIALDNTRVAGDVTLRRATLKNEGWTLSLRNMRIEGQLTVAENNITGAVTLAGTRIGRLFDDPNNGWGSAKARDQIELNEVTLDLIGAPDYMRRPLWRDRAKWLRRNAGEWKGIKSVFSNQPWRQVAAAFERAGLHADARRIRRAELCEANRHRGDTGAIAARFGQSLLAPRAEANQGLRGLFAFVASIALTPLFFFYAKLKQVAVWAFGEQLFGYGLSVSRATVTALLIWALGAAGVVVMNERGALIAAQAPDRAVLRCAEGQPAIYALDVMIPVLDLGQERECVPGHAPGAELFEGYEHPYGDDRFLEEVAVWRWLKAIFALAGAAIVGFALLTYTGVFTPRARP